MSIFIDSTNLQHLQTVSDKGWIKGVTTNPLLLAQSGMLVDSLLSAIKQLTSGPIFYQLTSTHFEQMIAEAYQVQEILDKQLVLKLPPSDLGFNVCAQLSSKIACCPTAIYAPAQALVAREAGAQYLAVYVNRASRLMGDGIQLVRDIAAVLIGSNTALLAASLKSPAEAVDAFTSGAQHLTLPYETLIQMTQHELSNAAIDEFRKDGIGFV
ncbi:MAG: transaldolase family protein [Candidatus Marinimicrobia bacterium]|nr:transaldolase family protein [Candidatus Neomarinimicrobiota bacterium]